MASSSITSTTSRPSAGAGAGSGAAAAAGSVAGMRTRKVLPAPGALRTPTSPPSSSPNARVSDRPRPVPPKRRVVEASACSKRWNSRDICSSDMPRPVSVTENSIQSVSSGPPGSRVADRVIRPPSVNFAALLSRLSSTWRTRVMSECMLPTLPPSTSSSRLSFLRTSPSAVAATSRTMSATSKSSAKVSILPLSTLDRSSTSLIRPSRWRALVSTLRMSRTTSSGPAPSSTSSTSISA